MSQSYRSLLLVSCLALALSLSPAGQASPDADKLRQAIRLGDVLPKAYRAHVTVEVSNDEVSVSAYRDPSASLTDCKIDAILLTHELIKVDRSIGRVRVAFYDLSDASKYALLEVSSTNVRAYGRGDISRSQIIKSVVVHDGQSSTVAQSYGGLSYKQMMDSVGVVSGPLRDKRGVALLRINGLQEQGKNVSELRKQFLHAEDLARRGEKERVLVALENLQRNLNAQPQADRLVELDAILAGTSAKPADVPGLENESVSTVSPKEVGP